MFACTTISLHLFPILSARAAHKSIKLSQTLKALIDRCSLSRLFSLSAALLAAILEIERYDREMMKSERERERAREREREFIF